MEYPFVGYAPDLDPTTPGIMMDCVNVIPSVRGMRSAFSAQNTTLPALATRARGGAAIRRLDDTSRLIIGTQTRLWEAGASSYTDVSRTAGGTYSCASDQLWTFAQFGNTTLAAQKADVIQASQTGAFANIASAPRAAIVETVGQFAFAFDTNETAYGDSPDRWWCSAIGDHTDWTPAIATQSATGRLIAGDGKITCGKRFGERIVAFKRNAMYVGSYTGAPFVWDWQQVQGNVGCLGKYAAVEVGSSEEPRMLFMGSDNFYAFDGSRPEPIGNGVRELVFRTLNLRNAQICSTLHDRGQKLVYFFYPTGADPVCNACVVYNYATGRWGRVNLTIETALDFISPGVTYDDIGSLYSTYDNMPEVTYDSAIWIAQSMTPAIVDSGQMLKTLDGARSVGYFITGYIGSDQVVTTVKRVTPRWISKPQAASMTSYYKPDLGRPTFNFVAPGQPTNNEVTDQTTVMNVNRFDLIRRANWHRFLIEWTAGSWEAPGMNIEVKEGGKE